MQSTLTISWRDRPIDPIVVEGVECGFALAKRYGYAGVELNGNSFEFEVPRLKQLLDQTGLHLSSIMTGAVNGNGDTLSSKDGCARTRSKAAIHRAIDVAAECGGLVSLGLAVGGRSGAGREQLVGSLRQLCDYAAEKDVRLCVEPINRYLGSGIVTVADALALIAEVDRDGLGITLDVFQANIEETSIADAIHQAGPHLYHIQLADNTRLVPGTGSIDFDTIRTALRMVGYSGWLSAELMPEPSPDAAARDWMTFYQEFTAMPPDLSLQRFEGLVQKLNADPVFLERAAFFEGTASLSIDGTEWVFRFADGKIVNVREGLPAAGVDFRFIAPNDEWDKLFSGKSHLIKSLNNYHGTMSVEGDPAKLNGNMRPLFYLFSSLKEIGNA
ncbi:TIM barrel protein [Ruegeria jejuensis]|uniref:TIM barrel protein n=1 Tax=Ruegeria jejuensis TaxID=3233338 RepID=UPI00355BA7AD